MFACSKAYMGLNNSILLNAFRRSKNTKGKQKSLRSRYWKMGTVKILEICYIDGVIINRRKRVRTIMKSADSLEKTRYSLTINSSKTKTMLNVQQVKHIGKYKFEKLRKYRYL